MVCAERRSLFDHKLEKTVPIDLVAAVRDQIEMLNTQEQLDHLSDAVKEKYKDVFSPIPHLDDLSTDIYCRIQLKDATKTFDACSYSTPHKYKEAWSTLIQ